MECFSLLKWPWYCKNNDPSQNWMNIDCSICSLQCGFPSPTQSSFTPESSRLLWLRSSSLRWGVWVEVNSSQHLLHWFNLKYKIVLKNKHIGLLNLSKYHFIFCDFDLVLQSFFWMLWLLAAALEDPPLMWCISSGQTHLAPLLKTATQTTELTTVHVRVCLLRDFLVSGSIGSLPLENSQSFSSFRQWNRLMHLSGERFFLIFSLMYLTVPSMLVELLPDSVSRPCRIVWLDYSERPRKRRNRSISPFSLCKAWSTAL